VAWTDKRSGAPITYAAGITSAGAVLDPNGQVVIADGSVANPRLASGGGARALLSYDRLDASAPFGNRRARARLIGATIAGAPPPAPVTRPSRAMAPAPLARRTLGSPPGPAAALPLAPATSPKRATESPLRVRPTK